MQAPPIRDDGLQVEDKRRLQRFFWSLERIAWAVFALVLLLAILGLTGSGGYFARATATFPAGEADYPQVSRWEASDELIIRFSEGADTRRLTLSPEFFYYFEVGGMQPEPERSFTGGNGVVMEFSAEQGAPVNVAIYVRALHPGKVDYRIGLDGDAAAASTIILP
jgi:hypothetical protein